MGQQGMESMTQHEARQVVAALVETCHTHESTGPWIQRWDEKGELYYSRPTCAHRSGGLSLVVNSLYCRRCWDELDEGQRIENDRIEREAWETKMTENLVDLFKEELGDQPERG